MFNNRLKITLLISLFLIFIIGCSNTTDTVKKDTNKESTAQERTEEVQSGGELKVAYAPQPDTVDLHMTQAVATSDIMRGVFESLVTVDSDYNVQPMLAESYEINEDGTQITFKLREGIQFHNGKEMKSDDVVASLDRWREYSSKGKAQFSEVIFEATDDYTVVLTFPERLSTALNVLSGMLGSYPGVMPKEVIDEAADIGVNEYIGTGPFKFEEWKQDAYIHLTKFDDYKPRDEETDGLAGKKEALVDDIYFHFILDSSTRVAGLLSDEYDIAHNIPYESAELLEESGEIENHIVPGSSLVLALNKKKGIFTDIKAREAVLTSLSMDDMMRAAFSDEKYYTLNHNMVMPYLEGQFYSDAGKDAFNQNNPEKAKQMIEENGYTGEEVVLLTSRDNEELYHTSVVLQQRLEEIGLKATLQVVDWPTFLEKKKDENEFDINITGFGPQSEPTSYSFVARGPHSGWTEDDEFHALITEFRGQPSLEDTKDVYEAMSVWNAENIPFIKIADFNRITSTQKYIENYQYLDGLILWNVSKTK